jgi:hypothetical protein
LDGALRLKLCGGIYNVEEAGLLEEMKEIGAKLGGKILLGGIHGKDIGILI